MLKTKKETVSGRHRRFHILKCEYNDNPQFQFMASLPQSGQLVASASLVAQSYTVMTFKSCTKCVGSQSILHDPTSACNPVSWSWMYE